MFQHKSTKICRAVSKIKLTKLRLNAVSIAAQYNAAFARNIFGNTQKCIQCTRPYHNITSALQQERLANKIFPTEAKIALLANPDILKISQNISRPVTKFSLQKGKRKTVKAVLKRFYRLDWGGWIRTKAGRHKKIWKKSLARRKRLQEHVFVNGTQSWLLDKMVTKYWRKPKYYVDDPYEPYHKREEFVITRKNPL